MSDIENELRALGDEHLTGYSRPRRQVAEVLWSAADEIERLRAQLDAALSVGPWSEPNDYAAGWNDALDTIREAIAGGDA